MNTAVINLKIDKKTKKDAQKIAEELGVSLSSIIKAYLRQVIRSKKVLFSSEEKPTEFMLNALKESREGIKAGRVTTFKNIDDALAYFKALELNGNNRR